MPLDRPTIERAARRYREDAPLYQVEREQIETLPRAFADGHFGRRDAIWVVRWYYRRFFGAISHAERREAEDRFERNDAGTVRDVVSTVANASVGAGSVTTDTGEDDHDATDTETVTTIGDAVTTLQRLEGMTIPVASAFLAFSHPGDAIVVGPRLWGELTGWNVLDDPYPDPPAIDDYERYLANCRSVVDRLDCDFWTLYRALWTLSDDR